MHLVYMNAYIGIIGSTLSNLLINVFFIFYTKNYTDIRVFFCFLTNKTARIQYTYKSIDLTQVIFQNNYNYMRLLLFFYFENKSYILNCRLPILFS